MKKLHLLTCLLTILSFGTVHLYTAAKEENSKAATKAATKIQAVFRDHRARNAIVEQTNVPTLTQEESTETNQLPSSHNSFQENETYEEFLAFLTTDPEDQTNEESNDSLVPENTEACFQAQTISNTEKDPIATKIQAAFRGHRARNAIKARNAIIDINRPKDDVPSVISQPQQAARSVEQTNVPTPTGEESTEPNKLPSNRNSFPEAETYKDDAPIELWEDGLYFYNHVTKPVCQTIAALLYKRTWKNLLAPDLAQALKWNGLSPADLANVAKNITNAMVQKLNGSKIGHKSDLIKLHKDQKKVDNIKDQNCP